MQIYRKQQNLFIFMAVPIKLRFFLSTHYTLAHSMIQNAANYQKYYLILQIRQQPKMLRPQTRHQPCLAQQNRINRHSSQLAIRKTSIHSSTPRDPHQSEVELRNIRQTTFWMKRTVGVGLENLQANCNGNGSGSGNGNGRKMEGRSRHVFSMKVNTENSETDSCVRKNQEIEHTEYTELQSKLLLIQKSQKQLGSEINLLTNENLPKLPSCHSLFTSLTKTLKLASRTLKKLSPNFQRILDVHLQLSSQLFEKVLCHSQNFITAQKSLSLVTRTVEQEREISGLMGRCAEYERMLARVKEEGREGREGGEGLGLREIDLERIGVENYRTGDWKQLTQMKVNQVCRSLVQNVVGMGTSCQIGYFSTMNDVLKRLMNSKQGPSIIKILLNEAKTKHDIDKTSSPSLNKQFVSDILKSNISYPILQTVKKRHQKFSNSSSKTPIKFLLNFLNKLSLLQDRHRLQQIILDLLSITELADHERTFNQSQLKEVRDKMEEDSASVYEGQSRKGKEIGVGSGVVSQKQLLRFNNKRLVNCASLYHRKKKRDRSPAEHHTGPQEQSTNQCMDIPTTRLNIFLHTEDIPILGYYFLQNQLQYLSSTILSLSRPSPTSIPVLNSSQLHQLAQTLLVPNFHPSLTQTQTPSTTQQKQQIFELAGTVAKAYGQDRGLERELMERAVREWLRVVEGEVLGTLGEERRLVLGELDMNGN